MKKHTIFIFIWVMLLFIKNKKAYAYEPMIIGTETKTNAGLGVVTSNGAASFFYNPAISSIMESKKDLYYEQEIFYLRLSYDKPDYDKFIYNLILTPFTLGGRYRINDNIVIGAAIIPTGTGGDIKIKGLPFEIIPNIDVVDVITAKLGFYSSLGISYKFSFNFSLGLAWAYINESEKLKIIIHNTDNILVDSKRKGVASKIIFGALYKKDKYVVGASITTPAIQKFRGSTLLPSENLTSTAEKIRYFPLTSAIGSKISVNDSVIIGLEYAFEYLSPGRSKEKRGFETDPDQVALKNTNNISFNIKYQLSDNNIINGGVSYLPSTKDPGTYDKDGKITKAGVSFSDLQALDRYSIGIGIERKTQKYFSSIQGGCFYTFGNNKVPFDHPERGEYRMDLLFFTFRAIFN